MKKAISGLIFRIIGLIIGISGITIHLVFHTTPDAAFMGSHVMAYFTIQTNFFTTFIFLWLLLKTAYVGIKMHKLELVHIFPSFHLACTFFITITMLGYWLILMPMSSLPKNPMLAASNFLLHTFTPLCAIVDCIFFFDHGKLNWKDAFKWLTYPVLYLISVIIIAQVSNEPYYTIQGKQLQYPYPFLDPQFVGVGGMIGCIIGLAVFFVLFALLYIFVYNQISKSI